MTSMHLIDDRARTAITAATAHNADENERPHQANPPDDFDPARTRTHQMLRRVGRFVLIVI